MAGFFSRLDTSLQPFMNSLSLLVLRIVFGPLLVFLHGWPKLQNFSALSNSFPDPLHLHSRTISLCLVLFAEIFCGVLVSLGLFTRAASVPVVIFLSVGLLKIHSHDTLEKQELAWLYFAAFFLLMLRGGGELSLDSIVRKKSGSSPKR